MEEEAHVGNDDVVDVSEQLGGGMISELTRSEGIEAADPSQQSALLGQFFVDEGSDWSKSNEPGPLDKVHFVGINI